MTVKEIIKITATLIGREDVVSYLDNTDNGNLTAIETVDVMVRLTNLVVNELACSFVPMKKVESINANLGKIYYTRLSSSPLEILNAYDDYGNSVLANVTPLFATVGADKVDIEYSFIPPTLGLDDIVGYSEAQVPSRVIAYGVASEYAITQGCFKDAVMWHERFADAVLELSLPKNKKIKRRAWL